MSILTIQSHAKSFEKLRLRAAKAFFSEHEFLDSPSDPISMDDVLPEILAYVELYNRLITEVTQGEAEYPAESSIQLIQAVAGAIVGIYNSLYEIGYDNEVVKGLTRPLRI